MLQHYFQIAIRHLLKYKTQNLISIVGLAVCLLCFSICMYCSRFFLSIDQCFENHDHIADIVLKSSNGEFFSGTPATVFEQLQDIPLNEVDILTHIANADPRPYNIEMKDGKEYPFTEMSTIEIDSCFRQVFTPKIIAGSWDVAVHTPNAIIMMESTARKVFGENGDPIGKRMVLTKKLMSSPDATPNSGGTVYTIQAIIKDIPQNNSLNFCNRIDLLVLNDSEGLFQSESRKFTTGCSTFALLHKGKSVQQLEDHLRELNLSSDAFPDNTICATALGKGAYSATFSPYFISVTTALGILILLIGLLNFFHFLIGSFFNRTKEYSIMKMIGCNWKQLFCLLFTQSLIVISISSILVLSGIELLGNHMNFSLPGFAMTFTSETLLIHALQYIVLLIILCVLICLSVSIRIRRITVQTGIYGNNKRRGKQWGRNLMLGIQFFICWVFVSLTAALYLQAEKTTDSLIHTLSQKEKSEILSIPLDYPFMKNEEKLALIERFKQHAGVKEILLSDVGYMQGMSGNRLTTEKGNENSWIDISVMAVPANFFSFMNIPIEQGRLPQTEKDIVVDNLWQEMQKKDVIGMNLYSGNTDYTICGISAPFQANVYNRSSGYAFLPYDPSVYIGHCYIKSHPGQQKEVARWIEKVYREMLPENITYQAKTFLDDIHVLQALEYNLKDIILFFAVISIIITLLGVYSSITLDTERRQKEVAIRKVNGADVPQIILLFARLYIILLLCSAIVAFPLVYVVLMLWKQMYTVFFDCGLLFWLCIFLIVTFITGFTILFRILRIAKTNPAEVIKNE